MTLDFNSTGGDGVLDMTSFDQRDRFPYGAAPVVAPQSSSHSSPAASSSVMPSTRSWPIPLDMVSPTASNPADDSQTNMDSPSLHSASPLSQHSPFQHPASPMSDWNVQQRLQQQSQQQHQHEHQQQQQQQQQQQHQQQPQQQPQQSQPQPQQPMTAPDLSHLVQDPSNLINFNTFQSPFQPNPLDYLPPTTQAALQEAALRASLQMEPTFSNMSSMSSVDDAQQAMWNGGLGMENWQEFQSTLQMDGLPRLDSLASNSPTNTYLEVLSIPSSAGDAGWSLVDITQQNFEQFQNQAAISNPGTTLHLRSVSDSSDGGNSMDFGSFEDVTPLHLSSPFSPSDSDEGSNHRACFGDGHHHQHSHAHAHAHAHAHPHAHAHAHAHSHPHSHTHSHSHSHEIVSPAAAVAPMPIVKNSASAASRPSPASGSGSTSPPNTTSPARRLSGPRKSPIAKTTKAVVRRTSTGDKSPNGEKKVGRRRGPLRPDQRKQASEIRKLRACLRCKFLKKTCDKGEPCAGCQPSHARLWQVPCTRIDIKDISYFMKDWKADYERHMSKGMSVYNVKGFAQKESLMWITHGYGYALPVMVREVYVADDSCFSVDWVESSRTDEPIDLTIRTEKLDVGHEGVSLEALAEYLDKHIDGTFEDFVDDHFDGTPFVTEILKTAHRFYRKEGLPIIRKALKLVVAYNLTLHITMVEGPGEESNINGEIDDEDSRWCGKIVAPVMVNFQIKCALADMWRELQKDILEELSSLYSSVYSGDRLKNWPTIFMLASILLAVWEEMQFDCHYRVPDPVAVNKFCTDMETTPVGVIVGLFHAISQKLPSFLEWDTKEHGHVLNNNASVCEAMTEVREHVTKHESYLRTRPDTKFDRYDFDSLSNKFLSKLVIRAN